MLIHEQKTAAEQLGITPRGLRDWMKEPGFPDCSAGYDLAAIGRWRDERDRKGSESGDRLRTIKLGIAAQKLRQEKARADAAERDEEEAKGNILPRDEYELSFRESIQTARDRLMGIPKSLCKFLPKKYHRLLQLEGKTEVRRILNEFARSLERGPVD